MKRLPQTALILLVLLPLGVALGLGVSALARTNAENALARGAELSASLESLARPASVLVSEWESDFRAQARQIGFDPARAQAWSESDPRIRQVFLIRLDGSLAWPVAARASIKEQAFLERAATFLGEAWLPPRRERDGWDPDGGWYRWFWQDGLQLVFWLPSDGGFVCLELNRSALLAELAARLEGPALSAETAVSHRVRLEDEMGRPFMQWGSWSADPSGSNQTPPVHASWRLPEPLDSWAITWDMAAGTPRDSGLGLAFGLAALIVAAAGLGLYVVRSWRRELREAGQRVSFVNQVSHELKTPLTNIRLYADLLETRIAGDSPRPDDLKAARAQLAVIQRECRRLGRLIHNVLSFGRRERTGTAEAPRPRPADPDRCAAECLDGFQPSLEARGLRVEFVPGVGRPLLIDPDQFDQILGNLLSNAEKYAASGDRVRVTTAWDGSALSLEVRDWGPGLPPGASRLVFEPFQRFHTRLTDSAGGTGLGLHLVRELARSHGGDAAWENARPGLRITVRLAAPAAPDTEDLTGGKP